MIPIRGFRGKYNFMSNFYLCPITYQGLKYKCSEAAFQAQKCLTLEDKIKFLSLEGPHSKTLGRQVQLRPDWDKIKIDIMRDVVSVKFEHPLLRQFLLETGDAYLEEANDWRDDFWGTVKGVGSNHLGKILMEVREKIKVN